MIITQGEQGFRRVRLQFPRILQSTFRGIAASGFGGFSSVGPAKVKHSVRARKPRPGKRKIGVKLYRPLKKTDGLPSEIAVVERGEEACLKSHATQIRIVSLGIGCCFDCQRLLLATGELGLQRFRDSYGDLALNAEDVSQLPVVGVCPEVGIGLCINQLHIDPHLIGCLLHATFKNVRYAKLLRDLREIARSILILLRRTARNYF